MTTDPSDATKIYGGAGISGNNGHGGFGGGGGGDKDGDDKDAGGFGSPIFETPMKLFLYNNRLSNLKF